ncbi:TBC1 domain family member 19 [Arapaima gigas]
MDEGAELAVAVSQVVQRLRGTQLHSHLEREAKECLHQPEIRLECLKEDVRNFLKKSGWERKLQNAVYRELHVLPPPGHPAAPPEHTKEPLAYMRKAQACWEKRILKSLNSMCTELGVPLARKRPLCEQKELLLKWSEMGTNEPDLGRFRPVYAPKDFLEVLTSLRNPNLDSSTVTNYRSHLGLIQVSLNVKDVPEMREFFSELCLEMCQLGIDDHTSKVCVAVLSEQDSAAAQQYSRQGCPTGLRAHLWALILNCSNTPEDVLRYEQLKSGVINHDLLVDNLIYKDVKLTATNDDYYFVFEDYLYQILLCFSRDTAVLEHFSCNSATPPASHAKGRTVCSSISHPHAAHCLHVSPAVAPLCFLYNEPSQLYSVFKEMYVRYFFRLHSISSSPSGVVSLCLQFEKLLQVHLPQLFYHLREAEAQPLRIAFKWMVRAFSGYLATDQLLLLWDRILGYDSLEILAVLAAAVFAFRAENLMEVTSLAAAEAVLADLSTLKVMPLLQIFMFATVI